MYTTQPRHVRKYRWDDRRDKDLKIVFIVTWLMLIPAMYLVFTHAWGFWWLLVWIGTPSLVASIIVSMDDISTWNRLRKVSRISHTCECAHQPYAR